MGINICCCLRVNIRLLTHEEPYANNRRIEDPYRSDGLRICVNDLPLLRLLQK